MAAGSPAAGIPLRLLREVPRPEAAARAPGRANLMGEHTDYNLGLVLPVALELSTWVAGSRRDDLVELRSLDAPGEAVVDLSTGVGPTDGWGRYATAVVRALRDESIPFRGLSGVVASDVPLGAGLASSAALEVAIASALAEEPLDPLQLARVCRRAENEYVGVACGLMDQLTSTAATDGHALLLDCRDETYRQVPLPVDLAVVVVDSGTKRSLGDGAFNERVERGKAAAAALGLGSLRELGVGDLEGFASDLPEELAGCARHVVTENERVRRTVAAFEDGSLSSLPGIFRGSHESLRSDLQVSTPEVDLLVQIAGETEGIIGARLTGAGFGGCTVNLVAGGHAEDAAASIAGRYEGLTGRSPRYWVSAPAAGAETICPV